MGWDALQTCDACDAGRAGVHLLSEEGYTGPDHWTC